LEDLGVDEE